MIRTAVQNRQIRLVFFGNGTMIGTAAASGPGSTTDRGEFRSGVGDASFVLIGAFLEFFTDVLRCSVTHEFLCDGDIA